MSQKESRSPEPKQKSPAGGDQASKTSGPKSQSHADAMLQEDINLSLKLPLPGADEFWDLGEGRIHKGRRGLMKIFKRKELTEDELSDLRQEAELAPGRARVKIQMLSKKYAENTSLIMLAALCTYRMVTNSTNRKNQLEGLRAATRDAAYVLINDGISIFNCETFFVLYFDYLTKFKRFQMITYREVRGSITHKSYRKGMATALKVCDSLLDEKSRAIKVLGHIKGKFKSSSYTIPWGFLDIQQAGKKVEQAEYKVICGPAEARETLVYSMALTDIFARIPILNPLVETIMNLMPESTSSLALRKESVKLAQSFTELNLAIQVENEEKKRSLGRHIYKTANDNMNRIASQPIKKSFEADPYFFLSRVTLLTFGSYNAKEQKIMLLNSIKAMKHAAKMDFTKDNVYTESAQMMERKLSNLLSEQPESDDDKENSESST